MLAVRRRWSYMESVHSVESAKHLSDPILALLNHPPSILPLFQQHHNFIPSPHQSPRSLENTHTHRLLVPVPSSKFVCCAATSPIKTPHTHSMEWKLNILSYPCAREHYSPNTIQNNRTLQMITMVKNGKSLSRCLLHCAEIGASQPELEPA